MVASHKPRVANPIAVRCYAVTGQPGGQVIVTIGKPRPERDPSVWRCSFLVEGIPRARRRVARGVDALDALQNAIHATRRSLKESGLSLALEGCEPGDIGIPRAVPSYRGSGLAEKIESYIDREEKKFLERAMARAAARRAAPPRD
jgi:hypothetical protein